MDIYNAIIKRHTIFMSDATENAEHFPSNVRNAKHSVVANEYTRNCQTTELLRNSVRFVRNRKSDSVERQFRSILDLKLELARRILGKCIFCERRCLANRLEGEMGHCRVLESKIATEFIHWGEEPELVPSYTIFFSSCTFHCVF